MKVLVAGGGIAGLTTALSLHQAGIEVRLFESARRFDALGVGINLQPHAVRELSELGLGDEVAATGIATAGLSYYNRHGQLIWSEPRGKAAGYAWPQYSIHRGAFLMVLHRAVARRIGVANLLTGHHLTAFEETAGGVVAVFTDRHSGTAVTERGDILVGADGIHSVVRSHFYPGEGAPRFAGQMMWRAAIEADPILDGRTHIFVGHGDKKFMAYAMGAPAAARGRALVNWITELSIPGDTPPRADWNKRVDKSVFAAAFADWRFPWLDIPGMIAATEAVYEFPKVDRDPIPRWSFGRVTLIGDAAHPMTPAGSQAGSQAIIDARVLTRALLLEPRPADALRRYEAERLPAMNDITLRNRQLGPEIVMQIVEDRAPDGFARIEDVVSRAELESFSSGFKRLAGFDRDQVNSQPPILHNLLPAQKSSPAG